MTELWQCFAKCAAITALNLISPMAPSSCSNTKDSLWAFSVWIKERDAPFTYAWYYELHLAAKRAKQVTTERGRGIKFARAQIRMTAKDSPQGQGEPSRWSEIEKWRKRRGQAFTLNDWDKAGREQGGKRQTEMLAEERQMANDRCERETMWEKTRGEEMCAWWTLKETISEAAVVNTWLDCGGTLVVENSTTKCGS